MASLSLKEWTTDAVVGRVYIGTPAYGGVVHAAFTSSLNDAIQALAKRGVQSAWVHTNGESLVHRARDTITAQFMADVDATHLMWIDADIGFRGDDVIRLLAHDQDIIGAVYPKKKYPIEAVVHGLDGAEPDERTGSIEVSAIGTGFLCTKRIVYERLAAESPELAYAVDGDSDAVAPHRHHYWPCAVEDGRLWSEDYMLCRRWRRLGGKVWADPNISLTHSGMHEFQFSNAD